MVRLVLFLLAGGLVGAGRVRRQGSLVPVKCSACEERAREHAAQLCCRCQDSGALCNNDLAEPSEGPLVLSPTPMPPPCTDAIFGCSESDSDNYNYDDTPEIPEYDDEVYDYDYIEATPFETGLETGLNCNNSIQCRLSEDCTKEENGCVVDGLSLFDLRMLDGVDLRQSTRRETCPRGQTLCCNPVPGDLFSTRLGVITGDNPLGDADQFSSKAFVDDGVCENPDLVATINFDFGLACGKRDSRVYYNAVRSETEGGEGEASNPGEWPWSVLIFRTDGPAGEEYLGAGTLMDNDVVVTLATKVRDFVDDPSKLRIRLGDWDPLQQAPNSQEDFPHVTMPAACVRLHPKFNSRSLAYNVAVVKLDQIVDNRQQTPEGLDVADVVVQFRTVSQLPASVGDAVLVETAPQRPATRPEGVEGSRRNPDREGQLGLRQAGRRGEDEQELRKRLLLELTNEVGFDSFIPRSYINTVCLPESQTQFVGGDRCWVPAWGNTLHEQREVELPLVGRSECNRQLGPEFRRRGVSSWTGITPSELCAGGEGRDACEGEGGAPLVCLDKAKDQYFAVGLVNYGFDCTGDMPAVYVNLADPQVKDFITQAFGEGFC